MALIEALLCGRPAVVTDAGDSARWVLDGSTGFVAAAARPRPLEEALDRAWNARHRWEEMGRAAHEFATSQREHHPEKRLLDILLEAAQQATV